MACKKSASRCCSIVHNGAGLLGVDLERHETTTTTRAAAYSRAGLVPGAFPFMRESNNRGSESRPIEAAADFRRFGGGLAMIIDALPLCSRRGCDLATTILDHQSKPLRNITSVTEMVQVRWCTGRPLATTPLM